MIPSVLTRRRGGAPTTLAVSMTAAASGSSGITVADDDDIDFGTGNFTIHWEGALPDWTPASVQTLAIKRMLDGSLRGWSLSINTTSALRFYLRNFSSTTLLDNALSTSLPTVTDGGNAKVTIVCVRETATVDGSLTFYFNGAQLGTSISIPAQTVVTVSNAEPLYIAGTSSTRIASTTRAFYLYNRALSAAEVLSLCNNGVATADVGASQTASYTSNFSAGTDSWTATRASVAGNIDGIGGADDWLRITSASGNNTHLAERTGVFPTITGIKYRISLQYYIPSTNSNANQIRFYDGNDRALSAFLGGTDTLTSVTFETTTAPNSGALRAYMARNGDTFFDDSGADDVVYIKSIVVTKIGCILQLDPAGLTASGLTWTDSSGNGNNGTLPAAGATKVTIRK